MPCKQFVVTVDKTVDESRGVFDLNGIHELRAFHALGERGYFIEPFLRLY